ncbi:MAG TPA: hypothetical protein VF746_13620 [Longimicrobium sp.]|jgi:hypothetical protein
MHTVTPLTVAAALLLYAGLFAAIRVIKPRLEPEERSTALLVGSAWAVSVFIANYLLFRAGVMSFLPWVNNFLHTFVWIGVCLTFLYLGVWRTQPMWLQFVLFATFSVVVKVFEQVLFGTWEHPNFFGVFQGNAAYVVGWSLADGLYPPITYYGLKLLGKRVPAMRPAV